jgi:hypothetical protein
MVRLGGIRAACPGGAMAAQPICNRQVRGSNPLSGSTQALRTGATATARGRSVMARQPDRFAHIAQLAEHTLGKGEVIGSNPIVGSSQERALSRISRAGAE